METVPSPIFFPEDSTKIQFKLAGLLAHLAFCGLPVPHGTVAEVAKAFQRLTAAGTAPVSHRIPFSDEFLNRKEHEVITTQHEEDILKNNNPGETLWFSLRSL